MRLTSILALLLMFCITVFSTTPIIADTAESRPNFLFIYLDDQRWDAMGVVQKEQGDKARFPWIKTPNMDRLASEGVRFRNAFVVNSLCAPSRATMLTGCYGYNNGIVNNHTHLPADSITYATELSKAGYATGFIGKWHMGNQSGQRPGFSYSASFIGQGIFNNCVFEINGMPTRTQGWVDDVSTDFALKFIREQKDKPFILAVGFKSTHGPRTPPARFANLYAGEKARTVPNMSSSAIYQKAANAINVPPTPPGDADKTDLDYHRCVHAVDENIGKLLDELDKLKLTDNTMVIFSSDNGYYLGEHKLGDKRSAYEESLRVPMIVRYPKLVKKAKTVDTAVLNLDIAPTILNIAGVEVPKKMQGKSWLPLLISDGADWRRSFFYCYFFERNFKTPTVTAVRNENAKLVKYPGHTEWTELFDLKADPYEMKNLVSDPAYAKLLTQMEAEYDNQAKEIGFQIPSFADVPDANDPAKPKKEKPKSNKPELVLEYQFGNEAGEKAIDKSDKGHTIAAALAPLVDGRDGHKARKFDGKTTLTVGKSADLAPVASAWTVEVTFKSEKPSGILVAHGGKTNGYCLYLNKGKASWTVNSTGTPNTITTPEPVAEGWHTLVGKITAKGKLVLVLDGKQVADGSLNALIPKDPNDGLDIGGDLRSAVVTEPGLTSFTGLIETIRIFNHEKQ